MESGHLGVGEVHCEEGICHGNQRVSIVAPHSSVRQSVLGADVYQPYPLAVLTHGPGVCKQTRPLGI